MCGYDREFRSSCLNIEDSIATISLREDHAILWILQDYSSQSGLGEERLRIKHPWFARRHKTLRTGNPEVRILHPIATKSKPPAGLSRNPNKSNSSPVFVREN